MGKYSISELENLSGIKAHTIRIWEQRYNLLIPQRTETNIRFYDDEQLKKLLNVSALIKNGMKISDVSKLSESDLHLLVGNVRANHHNVHFQYEIYVNQLVASTLSYNEQAFEKTFSNCVIKYGFKNCYVQILYPLLIKLGLMWTTNEVSPGQQHFVANLIKQKFYSAIDDLPNPIGSDKACLLFLPEGEHHEIGLLFANYILRQNNCKVIYLGPTVPLDSIREAVNFCNPTSILTFIVSNNLGYNLQDYIDNLSLSFPSINILISGNSDVLSQVQLANNVFWITTVDDLQGKAY